MTPDEQHAADDVPRRRAVVPVLHGFFPHGSGGGRRRIELHDLFAAVLPDGHVPGDELWMGKGDSRPPVQHDVELLQALRAEGLDGFIWPELQDRLCRYGLGVMGAWLVSREIYDRTAQKGRPVKPPDPPRTADERTALAIDRVADGVKLRERQELAG